MKTDQYRARVNGFTIVELLIVVVVIAILAAITIVSFSGIQNSAYDSVVQNDLKQLATKVEIYRTQNGVLPRDADFQAMGIKVAKGAYSDTLLISGTTKYNLIYCSPTSSDLNYTFAAQSKSGRVFKNGTSGAGEFTSSGSASSITLCTEAGVPTTDATANSRTFFYANNWLSWVQ